MIYCLRSSSMHAIQAGASEPKIISLYIVMVYLMLLQALPLFSYNFDEVYSTFLEVLTATSCPFIISFVTQAGCKNLFGLLFLHLKKSIIIIITQHAALLVICIGVFTLFNMHLRMIIFTLFVDRINL